MAETSQDILDVAVVGGGVSGIYSGWRILTETKGDGGAPPKVALFESSGRLGGRLLSVVPPGVPDTHVELGGMRYTSAHKRVSALVDRLELKHDDFPVSEPQNIAYVRGEMLRHQDLVDAAAIPYNLAPDERSTTALDAGFTAVAARRVVRVVLGKDVPLEKVDWTSLASQRYHGKLLSDLPMQYVIQRSISEEAFKFAEDTSGYDSILHTWNAADGLPWNLADFGQPVSFYHVHDGFAALPLTIGELFRKSGGAIQLHHQLKCFDAIKLPGGSEGIALHLSVNGRASATVLARRLILAMPRRALELLDQTGAVLGPENARVHQLIRSVTPIPLFKLALCYPFAWWETLDPVEVNANGATQLAKITKGQSIADLPIRQCYYWAKDEKTGNAVLLIYDDGGDLDFWAGLRDRAHSEAFASSAAASADDAQQSLWAEHKAPRLMVEEAHRQLCVMHGVQNRSDIPKPYGAAFRDGGEDPFGGGANFWHLHVKSDEVSVNILQPKPPVPVFICGEAYSHDQGWVEGALATADEMLARHFGLESPLRP